jgi:hypothetical protein
MFEEKLYQMEIMKRKKLKLEWKYHTKKLFKPNKISFTQEEKELIKNLLYTPMSRHRRKDYWLIASGAKREMLNNKGYYQSLLKHFPNGTQSPSEKIINLDIPRTFPNEPFFKEERNRDKLKNILTAFVRRNTSIGYTQGFNCIVGKLLLVVGDEEEVFWIFTQMIECYLPGDFYLVFTGVRKDIKIIVEIVSKTLKFCDQSIILCLNNLVGKTFISLFSREIPNELTYQIWDAFFIYGEIILYKAFIWIAYLFCDNTLKNKDVEAVSEYIDNKMKQTNDSNNLNYFLLMYDGINNNKLKQWKKMIENSVEKDTFKGSNNQKKEIKCDKSMPYCLYNKDSEDIKKQSRFIIHKMNHKIELYDNYFDDIHYKSNEDNNSNKENNIINDDIINIENNNELNISQDSLLIQRQKHCCP